MIKVNKKKVGEILKNIKDKDSFTLELVTALNKSISTNNPGFVRQCLNEWEASAELNQIPGLTRNVRNRFNSLVKVGLAK